MTHIHHILGTVLPGWVMGWDFKNKEKTMVTLIFSVMV